MVAPIFSTEPEPVIEPDRVTDVVGVRSSWPVRATSPFTSGLVLPLIAVSACVSVGLAGRVVSATSVTLTANAWVTVFTPSDARTVRL